MKLTLREKLVLLFHHELKDRFNLNDYRFKTTFAGAMLFELLEMKRLNIVDGKLVTLANSKDLSKDLKKVYKKIQAKDKPKKVCYWVAKFSENSEKYRKYILKKMSSEGLLTIEKKRYLFFFEKEITHLLKTDLRDQIVNELRAVLMEEKRPNYNEMALICLIDAADVYRLISNVRGECPKMRRKFKALVGEEAAGQGVTEALEMVQSAIFNSLVENNDSASCETE